MNARASAGELRTIQSIQRCASATLAFHQPRHQRGDSRPLRSQGPAGSSASSRTWRLRSASLKVCIPSSAAERHAAAIKSRDPTKLSAGYDPQPGRLVVRRSDQSRAVGAEVSLSNASPMSGQRGDLGACGDVPELGGLIDGRRDEQPPVLAERGMRNAAPMTNEGEDFSAGVSVPQFRCSISGRCDDSRTVRTESGKHDVLLARERSELDPLGEIPQFCGETPRGQNAGSVRAEDRASDLPAVSVDAGNECACCRVPQNGSRVVGRRHYKAGIRTESDVQHRPPMSGKRCELSSGLRVPEPRRVIERRGGDPGSVWAEDRVRQLLLVAGKGEDLPTRGDVPQLGCAVGRRGYHARAVGTEHRVSHAIRVPG